jgi:hypothetical protein
MSYVVQALLATGKDAITSGLASGALTRWGGVVRIAAGNPGAGTIVAHLRDIVPMAGQLASPLGVVQTASSMVANGQLYAIQSKLGTVLQMTNVAAAASVLNLGVSAVGFAIMNAKLNRLQGDMTKLTRLAQENHSQVMSRFDGVETRLVELRYIGLESQEMLIETLQELRNVRKDLVDGYLAEMTAAAAHVRADSRRGDHELAEAWKTCTKARSWFALGIESATLAPDRTQVWLDTLTRFRGWCFAVAGEVYYARRSGDLDTAASVARDAAQQCRAWAARWADSALPPSEFGGVRRYFHSAFHRLPAEAVLRLHRLQMGDVRVLRDGKAIDVARHVSEQLPALGPGWTDRQLALAEVLDFVEESTERVEALAAETQWCAERRLDVSRWEALPAPSENDGIGVIAREAA